MLMTIASITPQLTHTLEWISRFDVLVIHFPIAMVLGAALAETWSILRRTAPVTPVVRFCICCGSIGAVAAALLGWPHAALGGFDDSPSLTLTLHRWLGIAATIVALIAFALSEMDFRRGSRSMAFRVVLFSAAIMIGA